eukprot:scaffold355248_cov15-Prasinocladus_malaysianus.AAC.1
MRECFKHMQSHVKRKTGSACRRHWGTYLVVGSKTLRVFSKTRRHVFFLEKGGFLAQESLVVAKWSTVPLDGYHELVLTDVDEGSKCEASS